MTVSQLRLHDREGATLNQWTARRQTLRLGPRVAPVPVQCRSGILLSENGEVVHAIRVAEQAVRRHGAPSFP